MIEFFDGTLWPIATAFVGWSIIVGAVVYIPFRRSPVAAQAWLLLFFFMPWAALLAYLAVGNANHPKWRRDRIAEVPDIVRKAIAHISLDRMAGMRTLRPAHRATAHLVHRIGRFPCVADNKIVLDADYNRVVDRIAADIDAAQHHAHVLVYILQNDQAGNKVLSALERAARKAAVGNQTRQQVVDMINTEVRAILPKASKSDPAAVTITPQSYFNFSAVGGGERITGDTAPVGVYNVGDCYEDRNGNGRYDATGGGGDNLGTADDIIFYTVSVSIPRLFPIAQLIGGSPNSTAVAKTLIRNQPYGAQQVLIRCN